MSQTKITNKKQNKHTPVLLREVLDLLSPKKGDTYLDLTAGYGGHASQILDKTLSDAVLIDRDVIAIAELTKRFGNRAATRILHKDYVQACKELVQKTMRFNVILADLGISSPHIDSANRGFSFAQDGPLDMRMDPSQELTAEQVVNTYKQTDLEQILRAYGEEPKAKRMAELIVRSRPLHSTQQLAAVAKKVWPARSRVHPATRLFQAIRIEVNDELTQIESVLPLLVELLKPGGKLAIITFHSLEDRIVKRFLKEKAGDRYDAELTEITPKPVGPSHHELVLNPRARSAKIRVAQRK